MTNQNKGFKKYIVWFWSLVVVFLAAGFLLFFMISKGMLGFMPSFEELENPKSILASEIYTNDGKILDKYFIRENRSYISYKNLPPSLIDALIATEDVRFYKHSGIDLRGFLRSPLMEI